MNKLPVIVLGKILSYSDSCCAAGINRKFLHALAECVDSNSERTKILRIISLIKVLRYCAVTNSIKIWKIFESIADKCILTYDFISDKSSQEIDQKKFNPTDVYAITRNVLGASYASWDNVPTQEIEEDRRGLITNDEDEAITEIENTLPVRPVVSNHINDILNTLMSGRSNFMQNMHNTIFNNSGHSNLHPGDATIHDQLNIITETKDVLLFAKDQKQIISSDLAKTTAESKTVDTSIWEDRSRPRFDYKTCDLCDSIYHLPKNHKHYNSLDNLNLLPIHDELFMIPNEIYEANKFIIDSYNEGTFESNFRFPKSLHKFVIEDKNNRGFTSMSIFKSWINTSLDSMWSDNSWMTKLTDSDNYFTLPLNLTCEIDEYTIYGDTVAFPVEFSLFLSETRLRYFNEFDRIDVRTLSTMTREDEIPNVSVLEDIDLSVPDVTNLASIVGSRFMIEFADKEEELKFVRKFKSGSLTNDVIRDMTTTTIKAMHVITDDGKLQYIEFKQSVLIPGALDEEDEAMSYVRESEEISILLKEHIKLEDYEFDESELPEIRPGAPAETSVPASRDPIVHLSLPDIQRLRDACDQIISQDSVNIEDVIKTLNLNK